MISREKTAMPCDFLTELKKCRSVLISGHVNPDGDSTGSSIAFYHILKSLGITGILYSHDSYPYNFMFLEGAGLLINEVPAVEPDMYIVLDAGSPDRVGSRLFDVMKKSNKPKVFFDHHVEYRDPLEFFNFAFVDEHAAATGVMIYRFIKENGLAMDKNIATALYSAIMSDTGGLRYNSSNAEAFTVLSELVGFVQPWEISSNIWENVPLNQIRMLAEVLSRMDIIAGGRAAVIEITLEQMEKYGMGPDNVDGFINFGRSIQGVEVAMRFRELEKNLYKVSMRSRGNIDASKISNEFGGGGHRNAAGFNFKGTYADAVKLVEDIVKRVCTK